MDMETLTIKIDTNSNKGKYLFGLITEMAKEGTFIEIEKDDIYEDIKTSIKEVKAGKRKPINELFK
jgi:hypothetical protein